MNLEHDVRVSHFPRLIANPGSVSTGIGMGGGKVKQHARIEKNVDARRINCVELIIGDL